jgi:glycosyltransferase involved in cell wall biosynthesis
MTPVGVVELTNASTSTKRLITMVAFSCRPDSGSEWGVGWNFLLFYASLFDEVHLFVRDAEDQVNRIRTRLETLEIQNCKIVPVKDFNPLGFRYSGRWEGLNYLLWIRKVFWILLINRNWRKAQFISQPTWVSDWNWSPIFYLPYTKKIVGPLGSQPSNFIKSKQNLRAKIRLAVKTALRFNPLLLQNAISSDIIIGGITVSTKMTPWQYFNKKVVNIPSVHSEFPTKSHVNTARSGPPELIFVGKYLDFKNIELFCQAADVCLREIDDLVVTFMGDKLEGNQSVDKILENYPDRVRELGKLQHRKVYEILQTANGILLQTSAEHGGTVAVEASSLGVPIICPSGLGIDALLPSDHDLTYSTSLERPEQEILTLVRRVFENYAHYSYDAVEKATHFSKHRTSVELKKAIEGVL